MNLGRLTRIHSLCERMPVRRIWLDGHGLLTRTKKPASNPLDGYIYHTLVKRKRDERGDGAAAVAAAAIVGWSYVHLGFGPSLIRHIKSKGVIKWSIQGRLAHIRYRYPVSSPSLNIFRSCLHFI